MTDAIILSSRIRLARNAKKFPFYLTADNAEKLIITAYDALKKIDKFTFYKMSSLSEVQLVAMMERHLISQDLIKNRQHSAAAVSQDEAISIMIGEEDHLREQCILKGLSIKEAYSRLSLIDRTLKTEIDFSFDQSFGYLTSCLTNLGTGMRASVMMFLPALSLTNAIEECFAGVARLNMAIRGLYGEGSESSGYIYQISNQRTMGLTENVIIQSVESAARHILNVEERAREFLIKTDPYNIKDKIKRSLGILTSCYKLSHEEFINLAAFIKLGLYYGLILPKTSDSTFALDELITDTAPANISYKKQNMIPIERDILRAEIVGRELRKLFI